MKQSKYLWLAGASMAMMSSAALAQEQASPSTTATTSSSPATNAAPSEIVVTGSRVITNGNNSPTPLTIISTEKLAATTPSNIPDGLRKLPTFGASRSASSLGNAGANNVGNYLNLRAFGIIRTLILFDGHRVPATNADGTVDTNTLPELLLQRVDVVTGGASAVYGSDAVTGVVNFVLDKKFNGIKMNAQSGISQYGDAASYRVGIAGGSDLFGGRAHIEGSYERFRQNGLGDKFDRPQGRKVYLEEGNGSTVPFHLIDNARANNSSFGGLILTGALAGQNFYANGLYRPFVHGAPTGSAGIESGGDGTYNLGSSISSTLQTDQGFGRFDFDVSDTTKFYAQVGVARTHNNTNFGPGGINNLTISATNPYLPANAAAALAAAGQSTFQFSRSIIDRPEFIVDATSLNVDATAGLSGKLGDLFDWDLYYTHGWTRQHLQALNNINNGKLAAALDAVRDPATGNIVCRTALTNPTGAYQGCAPFNPFGPSSESDAAWNYVTGNTGFYLTNKVDDVGGTVSGSPFSTWAGPVKVAVSGEFRRLTLENRTNADPRVHPDCTGLVYNCTSQTALWENNTVAPVHAGESISEGAIEANIPILRDMPFAKSLDINGAFRYAHYSVSGNAKTWKVGGDWHVNDQISFRATRSQDIRAPTLNDLFAPLNVSLTGYTDLHTNLAQTVTVVTQGNPNLVPEVAQTLTLGMVLKPHFLPRFSLSVDYFHIKINNAIAGVGGNSAATEAQCEQSNGTSPLCALYVRPLPFSDHSAANFPTEIITESLNVASTKTKGVDFEANYSAPLQFGSSSFMQNGNLNLRGLMTYQPVLTTVQFAGAAPIRAAGVAGQQAQLGIAKIRATLLVNYSTDGWSLDIQERWRSHLAQNGTPGLLFADPKVPAAAFTDMTFTIRAGQDRRFEFFVNVQNLLNKKPPVFISTNFSSNPNFFFPVADGDDYIGRYFTAGARVRF